MAISAEIKEVIRLATNLSELENKLQSLKDKKADYQAHIADLNTQIDLALPIVQSARLELKAAAALIK